MADIRSVSKSYTISKDKRQKHAYHLDLHIPDRGDSNGLKNC